MKTLDRSKPFTEVYGNDPAIEYRYTQGGVKFDEAGNEIAAGESDAEPASGKKSAKKAEGG